MTSASLRNSGCDALKNPATRSLVRSVRRADMGAHVLPQQELRPSRGRVDGHREREHLREIASITTAGQVFGTPVSVSNMDYFGFAARQIGEAKVGGNTITFLAASQVVDETTDFHKVQARRGRHLAAKK